MKTVKIQRHRVSRRALAAAAAVLEAGGVVAFPTETSYGLAANPADASAVRRVYAIKGRPAKKPLPLVAASARDAAKAFSLNGASADLARRHWPGPLTLVLPAKRGIRLPALAGGKAGAVRVPASAWARAIAAACGGLATSTSANRSGDAPCYRPADIRAAFASRSAAPDLLLDAGTLRARPASTIVRAHGKRLDVLRQGSVRL
jgi:L-threonylcarbamoyladenylate synthase